MSKVFVQKYTGKYVPVKTGDATNIVIHSSSKRLGAELSPFILKNEKGQILENVWQFSKVYEKVTQQKTRKSRYHAEIIWEHPEEIHVDADGEITEEYWNWREKGMNNTYAVRYPNGYRGKAKCLFSLYEFAPSCYVPLNYIESRKMLYCAEYTRLAPLTDTFQKMKQLLERGDVIIHEVDGPDPSLDYFPFDSLTEENPALEIDEKVIRTLIEDTRRPFGHGYVIGALLLGGQKWMC